MEIVYGTYNISKLNSMIKMLEGLEVKIVGLSDFGMNLKKSKETGKDPLENAEQKARNYFKQIKKPVFSCDSGLYFENVEEKDQPGILIRRIGNKKLSDEEMIEYYSNLAKKYGGQLKAYYKNAICLIINNKEKYSYVGKDIYSEKFLIVDKPHKSYKEGFPLNSLSVDISTNKYYFDLSREKEDNLDIKIGFRNFFINSLNIERKGI
ncbi:non-canonical purine NTP pyrophosphatase [Haliovirga abyssi]|uniref:Non-canonical purine NTP pyrophosphatase n=1 Tax=Haliovirga abyssi TaxID=2996794 RepID=A0AAU9D9Y7_9FUSO|nr:non-canonical purine NTP pyrophosphatase [Haliovirga abyssi]BDU50406.1 hypothetical protein HLVA_09750 [Haliovirga abyssi]